MNRYRSESSNGELYPDNRTDSLDIQENHHENSSVNSERIHNTRSSNLACSFESGQLKAGNKANLMGKNLTGSSKICLTSEQCRDRNSNASQISLKQRTTSDAGYASMSSDCLTDASDGQQLHSNNQSQQDVENGHKAAESLEYSNQSSTGQYACDEIILSGRKSPSIHVPGKNFHPASRTRMDSQNHSLEISSSVKVVTTESDSGALQMFLVEDPDNDFGANSSGNDQEQLHSGCQEDDREIQDSSKEDLDPTRKKERQEVDKDTTPSAIGEDATPGTEKSNRRGDYDKPSRRSLRLKAGKRSIPSFTYKLKSDDEDQDMMEIENAIMAIKANEAKMAKTVKGKSPGRKSASAAKPYACDQCSVTCRTASNLNQHKQTHLVGKPFACPQCSYTCKRKSDLKKHEETHGPKNMYQCMLCDYAGKRLKYLKKHMRTHNRETVSFSCHLCDYRSKNKVALDNHLFGHASLKPHNCVECGEGFEEESALQNHMETHPHESPFPCTSFQNNDHPRKGEGKNREVKTAESGTDCGGSMSEKQIDKAIEESSMEARTEKNNSFKNKIKINRIKGVKPPGTFGFMKMKGGPIQCTSCSYSCTSKNLLRRHMRRHSDSKPHICSQCGASFKRRDHLKVHKFTHSDLRPHQCPHCSYGTHRKYRLTLHILTHQTIKPIKCAECSYSCRRDCELRYHMRNKHGIEVPSSEPTSKAETAVTEAVGEVELKCQICDYTCDSQKRLKYHMARHENKTPHSCPHCDYKCSSRSSLTDHLLQHAGIKPCLCSVCGMAFRNTSRLNRHRLVHSDVKPYGCDFCDFSSRSKYNLKQHMLRHTDQERVRRRNRRPTKAKPSLVNTTEVIKQSYQPDIQAILGHMGTNLYPEAASIQQEHSQTTQDSQDSARFISSPHSGGPLPQYYSRNQIDMPHDHMKQRDRHYEQNGNSGFSTGYQNPIASINPFQAERSPGTSMATVPTYGDPYQHPNPFFSHGNRMPYNPNMNMGHSNPNFCYMDRGGGGYGFSNPYFYNETVFPGNMNPNLNFYLGPGSNSTYPLNHSPNLPMNQNSAHVSQQVTRPLPALIPPQPLPSSQNKDCSLKAENKDSNAEDLNHSDDASTDVILDQGLDEEKHSKSQAKKTGATLDSGSFSTKAPAADSPGKATHVCSDCGYICLTNTMLQRHKTTHLDLKPHKCEDCGKSFKRRDHMKAHKRTHSEDKPFGCKHCTYTCSRKYRLRLHEMTHTNEMIYPCHLCDATFESEDELQEHKKTHSESSEAMFSCEKCDFKCHRKMELKVHNESHRTFLCEQCSYVCRSSREFKSHKRMHAEKEELTCTICSYKCDSQKRLKYHMERHENKTPHACPQCDYKCSSRSSLTDHLLQHEGLKPFLCSICGMRFRNVSRLNRHKMTHTDIKPHSCDYCPFSSRSRYNLKQHMLRHFK